MRRLLRLSLIFVISLAFITCSDSSTGPDDGSDNNGDDSGSTTGSVKVVTETTGDNIDGDGYTVSVGENEEDISTDGSVTVENLDEGSYDVELSGIADNCSVDGDNPRSVDVTAGETTSTTINVSCEAKFGALEVTTSTSGQEQDSDGYTISVADQDTSVGINETVLVDSLDGGNYDAELTGLASNCSVDGNNPRSVSITVGDTTSTTFNINCQESTSSKIVFHRYVEGESYKIYTMNPDHSDVSLVTSDNNYGHEDPSWSPDGSKIVYENHTDNYQPDIFKMKPDGSENESLAASFNRERSPSWGGPQGNTIAFYMDESNDDIVNIYTVTADGSSQMQVTENGGLNPTWSSDGSRIIFESHRDGDSEIYSIKPDGTDLQQITDNTVTDETPSWSPDGSRIAFSSNRDDHQYNAIYTMDPDGSDVKQITDGDEDDALHPNWSPDGSQIVFQSGEDAALAPEPSVCTINLDGTDLNCTEGIAPDWSPKLN